MAIQNEMSHLVAVVRRDAAIRAQGGTVQRGGQAAPTTPSTKPGDDRTEIRKLLDLLELPWQTKVTDEQMDESAASVRAHADEAVRAIMKQYETTSDFSFRHQAVRVLQRLGTAKARAALLDIALARTADRLSSLHAWAANAYLRAILDKADARELLASNEAQVLNSALLAIKGLPVDEPLVDRIRQITQRKEEGGPAWMAIRFAAADVLSSDPRAVLLKERVDLVLAMLADVAKMPEPDKVYWPGYLTYSESAYHHMLYDLRQMPAEAGPLLRDACGKGRGVERDVVVMARALRGDAAVRNDVRAILADGQAGLRRAWAANALEAIGSAEDLPLLRKLAETDPFQRDRGGCVGPPPGIREAKFYPVREAAKQAIRAIER
jgi:hypothetical protein